MKKRGAIELSIGTIVIIVLAMTMLILGLVLVKNIFSASTSIIDLTEDQLLDKIRDLFGDEKKLVAYPSNRHIEIKQGKVDGFGFGIKNLESSSLIFSYEVIVSDTDVQTKCGVSDSQILSWISTGRAESGIPLSPGEITVGKVLLTIPTGSALCTFRFRINVRHENGEYASELMDVTIKT